MTVVTKDIGRQRKTGFKIVPPVGQQPKSEPTKTPTPEPIIATPETKPVVAAAPKEKKPVQKTLLGIRNWTESIGGVSADRMRDCIIYHLDYSKDKWWCPKINSGKGFLKSGEGKIARLLSDSVPEDFKYDPNGVIGWRSKPIEGSEDRAVEKFIRRDPISPEERDEIRAHFEITKYSRKFLKKKDCKKCSGTGFYDIYPYADNPRLPASVQCSCIEE